MANAPRPGGEAPSYGEKMIALEHAMVYQLDVTGPAAKDGSDSNPRRQYWQMSRATLKGPRIDATTAMPGIDWFTPYPDGYGRPHVRLSFLTHDEASKAFMKAVEEDTTTQWHDQYMRMALTFETSSPKYQWLMQSLFIARGRLLASKRIEYDVYPVL
jgi:Protein of unknown function (DUF3237)